jgi:3-deoxy-manno-octulosonate cytidylyltransferase (CMP-KDO synthetase)
MNVLGVIPARYGSSRFPGKPLIDLMGKTMIQRVYEGASRSSKINKLVVATDDERIVSVVEAFGGNVMLTNPNHPSGTDRCAEVLENHPEMDVVINIQGDEPLVNFLQLDQLIEAFHEDKTQIATLVNRNISLEDLQNPNRIKVVADCNSNALYFSRSPIPNFNHASKDAFKDYPFLRHIGLYAYRASVLRELTRLTPTQLEQIESLEQLRWLFYGYSIKLKATEIETPNIDVPADVEKVLAELKKEAI